MAGEYHSLKKQQYLNLIKECVSNLPIFGYFCHPIFAHKNTKKAAEASSWVGMRKMAQEKIEA